jgi:serine/threonine-protein kinase PknK
MRGCDGSAYYSVPVSEDVPGYKVLGGVGKGGFSIVYRAHQEALDRTVALKVLSIPTVDAGVMRRFQRECRITAGLSEHPNIVTVLDNGITRSGRPYIAMEYFAHGSLADRLRRDGPLPVADVLRIGVKTAGALAATHENNVLHRDVKPQNILVSRYGEPALTDFGIARLLDSLDTSSNGAFTPHHAPPEVFKGDPRGVGSDVYSLGSTLYQLLAGRPPFKGTSAGEGLAPLILRILHHAPPPIPRSDVPVQVTEAILRAMAKAPEERFATAAALARHLQQVQDELGLPITEPVYREVGTVTADAPTPHVSVAPPPAPDAPKSPTRRPQDPLPPARDTASAPGGDGRLRQRIVPLAATLAAGVVLGALALQVLPRSSQSETPSPSTPPSPTGSSAARGSAPAGTQGGDARPPIPQEQFAATRPSGVRVRDDTVRAALTWTLPSGARTLPIIVQALPEGSVPTVSAGLGARSATVGGLRPGTGYCFRVGALLQLNQGEPATMSWSEPPVCIRGARVQPRRT